MIWAGRSVAAPARAGIAPPRRTRSRRGAELPSGNGGAEGKPGGRIGKSRRAGRARVNFGGAAQVREQCRDVRGLGLLESVARDLRYGFRGLLRTPLFTAVAVLSLAFGIGATTAIFSVADAALWRMLPVRNPREFGAREVRPQG